MSRESIRFRIFPAKPERKAREIYQKKKEVISIYLFVKQQIDAKIEENKQLLGEYDLKIEASFGLQSDITSNILHYIKQNVKGSFKGKIEGETGTVIEAAMHIAAFHGCRYRLVGIHEGVPELRVLADEVELLPLQALGHAAAARQNSHDDQ